MIVCDRCRNPDSQPVFDCGLVIEKTDKKNNRPRVVYPPREVVKVPLQLCDPCITLVCKSMPAARDLLTKASQ